MSTTLKKGLIPILISIVLFLPLTSDAALTATDDTGTGRQSGILSPSQIDDYHFYDYVIDSYNVNIVVNENNTFDITETITAYFHDPKHGIIRDIPLQNTVKRLDGTSSQNRTKVSDVSVNDEFTKTINGNTYRLKIGSADKTITGEQTYVIAYHYNIGKDPVRNYDELYFNIIGNQWDTVIGNVTFQITMPKEFDAAGLGFSSGAKGSTANEHVNYQVSGNMITGSYDAVLDSGEALTIRMELPEGYFRGAGFKVRLSDCLVFIIPLLCLLGSYLLWVRYGKNDIAVDTVEFYPPDNLNSLELAYLYKGKAGSKDVVSLLIYLANEGYIKISEYEKKTLFASSKSFEVLRIKDYNGNNPNEKKFLRGLFACGSKGRVISSDLTNHFYVTTNAILRDVNSKLNKAKIFEQTPLWVNVLIILLSIVSMVSAVAIPTLQYAGLAQVAYICFILLFYTPFFIALLFAKVPIPIRLFFGCFLLIHLTMFLSTTTIAKIVFIEPFYLFGLLLAVICLFVMGCLARNISRRTPYGNKMLGKIRGFKRFLETAEKHRLEALVMEDPAYFYHILPYSYVLGVSDKWISKFESIAIPAPSWHDSQDDFDTRNFHQFMNHTMSTAQRSMASSPGSDSGGSSSGSSSGGGSSGGGSGGGGGSSW